MKKERKLCGIYFFVKTKSGRKPKCFSDMTIEEIKITFKEQATGNNYIEFLEGLSIQLSGAIYEIGECLDIEKEFLGVINERRNTKKSNQ